MPTPNLPKPSIFLELGDWVCEKMEYIQGKTRLSPPMYVVGIWTDGVYLEIDKEQGDPFEADYKDIVPIPITHEIVNKQTIARRIKAYCVRENGETLWKFKNDTVDTVFAYVHELQHLLRQIGCKDEIVL